MDGKMSSALSPGFKNSMHHPSFSFYILQKGFYNQDIFSVYYSKASLLSSTL